MPSLRIFYENEVMREDVRAYMVDTLKEIAVERTFNGEETKGIKDAHELIDRMFDRLDQEYGKIQVITQSNAR